MSGTCGPNGLSGALSTSARVQLAGGPPICCKHSSIACSSKVLSDLTAHAHFMGLQDVMTFYVERWLVEQRVSCDKGSRASPKVKRKNIRQDRLQVQIDYFWGSMFKDVDVSRS